LSEKKSTRKPRRNWPKSLKRKIVEESNAPGVSVCEVARGYDLDPAQLFSWRKKFGTSVEGPSPLSEETSFVAVDVSEAADEATEDCDDEPGQQRFEIAFPNGRHLFVPVGITSAMLSELIAAVGA
jgi:transposase-like protein